MKSRGNGGRWNDAMRDRTENYISNIKLEQLRPGARDAVEDIIGQYQQDGRLSLGQIGCLKRCRIASNLSTNQRGSATWYFGRKIGNPIG